MRETLRSLFRLPWRVGSSQLNEEEQQIGNRDLKAVCIHRKHRVLISYQETRPMMVKTRESLDLGVRAMTLAIVLGGWAVASVLFSPVIGRFLSGVNESPKPLHRSQQSGPFWIPPRHAGMAGPRRNVAMGLQRRGAGTPRAG
jgi:hypothetical protein